MRLIHFCRRMKCQDQDHIIRRHLLYEKVQHVDPCLSWALALDLCRRLNDFLTEMMSLVLKLQAQDSTHLCGQ